MFYLLFKVLFHYISIFSLSLLVYQWWYAYRSMRNREVAVSDVLDAVAIFSPWAGCPGPVG
jgi:hypothetical protein